MTKYRKATRADLMPGARFVVRRIGSDQFPLGSIITLHRDDGSDMPSFFSECGTQKWVHLDHLEPIEPAPATIAVPVEMARRFVEWRGEDGYARGSAAGAIMVCRDLHALFTAALTPPEPDDVRAARELLEARGYTVTRQEG